MLTGFFDETGIQQGERLTGVCGFVFRKEALSAVQEELSIAVNGSPPISASTLRYYGQHELLDIIARITGKHRGKGFIYTVSDQEFKTLASMSPHVGSCLGNPYSACILYILGMVKNYMLEMNEEAYYCGNCRRLVPG